MHMPEPLAKVEGSVGGGMPPRLTSRLNTDQSSPARSRNTSTSRTYTINTLANLDLAEAQIQIGHHVTPFSKSPLEPRDPNHIT